MPAHHPDEALLLDYATGALAEAFAVIVASHLTLCPACRHTVAAMEAVGGALIEQQEETGPPDHSFEALLDRLSEPAPQEPSAPAWDNTGRIPRPLLSRLPRNDRWRWLRLVGVDMMRLPCSEPGHRLRLLRIRPGFGVPHHSHEGQELALVLQGSFTDEAGCYRRGDIAAADGSVTHRQVADAGEICLCLVATSGRLRLTGPLSRLLDPFVRL